MWPKRDYYYYGSTALCWALVAFSVSWSYTQSEDSLDGGLPRRKASTYTQNNINTEQKHIIQKPIPWVEFELTIPVFERAKAVHALDRAATVIGT
jgi:hypothetical protein